MDIVKFCEDGIADAEQGIAAEKLSGNVVKEATYRGEAAAFRAVLCELGTTQAAATPHNSAMVEIAVVLGTLVAWLSELGEHNQVALLKRIDAVKARLRQ